MGQPSQRLASGTIYVAKSHFWCENVKIRNVVIDAITLGNIIYFILYGVISLLGPTSSDEHC